MSAEPPPGAKARAAAEFLVAQLRELELGPACPWCRSGANVLKYVRQRPGATHRHRQCRACGKRFRTVERAC